MPRARRICAKPGCPNLTTGTRCPAHQRDHEQARGTRQARGYDTTHDQLRATLDPLVDAEQVDCWRCGRRIPAGTPWHLGHDDHDRTVYRGPEHEACNLRAAGQASHRGD